MRPFRVLQLSACWTSSYPCRTLRHKNRHSEIMVMGWKHLGDELKTERTSSSVLELIKGMAEGHAAHRTDALKFGLYTALRLKDPSNSRRALLVCAEKTCRSKPVSYQSLGGGTGCAQCRVGKMVCTDCGHARVDRSTWCRSCRKLFE